jgi:hypothetical protein
VSNPIFPKDINLDIPVVWRRDVDILRFFGFSLTLERCPSSHVIRIIDGSLSLTSSMSQDELREEYSNHGPLQLSSDLIPGAVFLIRQVQM